MRNKLLAKLVYPVGLLAMFILTIGFSSFSYAETKPFHRAPVNPVFLEFLKNKRSQIADNVHMLGYIPGPVDLSHVRGKIDKGMNLVYAASYDLRTLNKLTAVRNQGSCGSCWTFGTYASLESFLKTAETKDFSEQDLNATHGFDWLECEGGNSFLSQAYLARWSGPLNESDVPYPYATFSPIKHVQQVIWLPGRASFTDNDTVKYFLTTYGAVYFAFDWFSTYWNAATNSYYNSVTTGGNHAIAIVGWDDNYDKNKFTTVPPANGAFICRNSWGSSWGESGYFYMSYYDTSLQELVSFNNAEAVGNYSAVHQYDPLGWVWNNSTGGGTTGWGANIFTATASQAIDAVGFITNDANTAYTIYVYKGVTAGQPTSGTLAATKTGTNTYPGYYTVKLDSPVSLTNGQLFSVVLKVINPSYTYPIVTEGYMEGYASNVTSNAGESFFSANGTTWSDMFDWGYKDNNTIKAFVAAIGTETIAVTAPNGGESWTVGASQNITWTSTGAIANVRIEYSTTNGSSWNDVIASTANDGSHSWTIPNSPSTTCLVRISDAANSATNDVSDAAFTISTVVTPTLTVTSPNGSENWTVGSSHNITWTNTGAIINVRIEYSTTNGSSWNDVVASTANDGSYSWTIPNSPSTTCLVRVSDAANSTTNDVSDAAFVISSPVISSISGQVTNTSGVGIQSIRVFVYDLDFNSMDYDDTDASGNYTVSGLPAGNFKVEFYNYGQNYVSEWYNDKVDFGTANQVTVIAGSNTPNINAQLATGGQISGRVTNTSAVGISDIWVEVHYLDGNQTVSHITDHSGNYTVSGLRSGSYKVFFPGGPNYASEWFNDKSNEGNANPVTVTAGNTTPDIDAQLASGGGIRGQVTDTSAAGIKGIYVLLYDLNNNLIDFFYILGDSGLYTFSSLPVGNYKVRFSNSGKNYVSEWYNDKISFEMADQVPVTAGNITFNIDAQLASGGGISGQVTDTSAVGIQDILVRVYDLNNNQMGSVNTDASGNYTVLGLPAGNLKVFFDRDSKNYLSEWYDDKSSFIAADPVAVTAGSTTPNINAQLAAVVSDSIAVTSPNGGESWMVGTSHDITWTSIGTIANVNIDYSTNSGGSWTPVIAGTANDGSYAWTVPNTLSTTCLVRVGDAADGLPTDASDAVFTIAANTTSYTISGTILVGSTPLAGVVMNGLTGSPTTNASGVYTGTVAYNWSGTVTPTLAGYTFSPANRSYSNVIANQTAQDYTATMLTYTISGTILVGSTPLAGVVMSGLTGSPTTNASGVYSGTVTYNWSGTVTPTLAGYTFSPANRSYSNVTANQTLQNYSATAIPDTINLTSPNGGENWTVGESHDITWTSNGTTPNINIKHFNDSSSNFTTVATGTIANVNIDYSSNSGGSWTPVVAGTANDGTYTWTVPSTPSTTCLVRVSDAANAATLDSSDAVFTILAIETVSTPSQPTGANSGLKATSYPFTTGGSTSSLGHGLQYKFDWDDGSDSGWLASGTTSASHSWAANGTYDVKAMARCVTHTTIESLWSTTHALIISDSGTSGKYNSPAQQKILPEVIWAPATGGGTWMSEVQVTDLSGGSQVSVYYSTAAGRRGPFALWTNGGGALRSQKYNNMLQTIDGLDSGVFTYYGTVGAVEFVSQDAAHVLQATARTLNGSYSKTFPAFSLHDSNTADTSRVMNITNLTSNSAYRSTVGFFNPTADALTMALKLIDSSNTQIGTTITKTINGFGFSAFFPFNDAGVPYPANSYDNVILVVQPTSGTGKVLCFGASANNVTNDPAAHIAVQNGSAHDNGPSRLQVLPEAIWAPASGGGTWMSEVQIIDVTGGSRVSFYFDYGNGNARGPFVLWTGGAAGSKVKYANILQQLGAVDTGFDYFGRVGTIGFFTMNDTYNIQVTARTLNGNYSKTFPGLNRVEAETADTSRVMIIQNFANNGTYRSTCGFFNPSTNALTVEFTLLNGSGATIGTPFSKTFVGFDFQAFSPFTESGVPYPANSFDNVILRVRPTSGSGQVVCFGASANNASNDPAAHLAVQGQ